MANKRCEIICVGTELLLGDILNTNAQYIAQGLSQLGLDLYMQTVVGDNPDRMAKAVRDAMDRANILLVSGGLGPTPDDLTKEVVAKCFGRRLIMNQEALDEIQAFYTMTQRPMPLNNQKQALVPEGGFILKNPNGTAPGVALFSDEGHVAFLMPGPPRELRPMFDNEVAPRLRQYSTGRLYSQVVRVVSLGESRMAEMLNDLLDSVNPTLAPYARDGEAMVRVTAKAKDAEEARRLTGPLVREVQRRLGRHAYGVDVPNLETVIAGYLAEAGLRVSFVEAGSGGLAARRMQGTDAADQMCLPSLSAPDAGALARCLGCEDDLPDTPEDACACLAELGQKRLGADIVLVIRMRDRQVACAVKTPHGTRRHARQLPARGLDYCQTAAVQAGFDLLRLALMDEYRVGMGD